LGDQAHHMLQLMIANPGITLEDASKLLGVSENELTSALSQLIGLGLVRLELGGKIFTATPTFVLAQVIAQQEKATRARILQLEKISETLSVLNASLMRFPAQTHALPGFTQLNGQRQISLALQEVAACAQAEVLSMHSGPPAPPAMLKQNLGWNREMIGRGVVTRSIHLMAMLNIAYSRVHLNDLRAVGAQVRVTSVLPFHLTIADRVVAYIPIVSQMDSDKVTALEIRDPRIIDLLLSVFEFCWVHGDVSPLPADPDGEELDEAPLDSRQHRVLRMLGQGLTDDAIARSLGISSRTLRRMMTEVMCELQANSRFQAGAHAAARGLLGPVVPKRQSPD
jgi:DNA-binding CsgD family transcriptional regulator